MYRQDKSPQVAFSAGLMPYNFICVEAGNVLGTLSSLDDLFSKTTLLKLLFLAFVMLLPSLYKRSRRQRHGWTANLDLASSYVL